MRVRRALSLLSLINALVLEEAQDNTAKEADTGFYDMRRGVTFCSASHVDLLEI